MTPKKNPSFRYESDITIEVQSNKPLESPFALYEETFGLYTKTIVDLITSAGHPFMWEKNESELQNKFYAHILSAVAQHYEADSPIEQQRTEYEILIELLNFLKNDLQLLQNPVTLNEHD